MTRNSAHNRYFERVLFKEKPKADNSFFGAIVLMLLIDDLVVVLLLLYLNVPIEVMYGVVVVNALLIGYVYVYLHFRTVKLTDHGVYIRFGISRSCVPLSEIRSFSVSDPPSWSKMGPGVSGFRGRKVYCFSTGSPFLMIEHGIKKPKRLFFNVDHLSEFTIKLREIKEHRRVVQT
jgi:hypothetical protein